eukprot:TRINITY_DN1225_c0_g2_i1.p3 TRINITY_DN1225_c0_g2~~TRINITY_DN1225_c0_g2_i1.p3  ORF type:complete len:111 (-),score=16.44 TRINITY_DN1225_c0_g2_i1:25-357(-)
MEKPQGGKETPQPPKESIVHTPLYYYSCNYTKHSVQKQNQVNERKLQPSKLGKRRFKFKNDRMGLAFFFFWKNKKKKKKRIPRENRMAKSKLNEARQKKKQQKEKFEKQE